jgi:hypothetical protein
VSNVDHGKTTDKEDFGVDDAFSISTMRDEVIRSRRCSSHDPGDEWRVDIRGNDHHGSEGATTSVDHIPNQVHCMCTHKIVPGACDSSDMKMIRSSICLVWFAPSLVLYRP